MTKNIAKFIRKTSTHARSKKTYDLYWHSYRRQGGSPPRPEAQLEEGSRVRIEPLNGESSVPIDLRAHRIDEAQAAELRARMARLAEDWENPEVAVYDNYDAAKANL